MSGMLKAITNEWSLFVLVKRISRRKEFDIRVSNQSLILGISEKGQILWIPRRRRFVFCCPPSWIWIQTK